MMNMQTRTDIARAITKNDSEALIRILAQVEKEEHHHTVVSAISDELLALRSTNDISDTCFDLLATFLIKHKLFDRWFAFRRKNTVLAAADERFSAFYRYYLGLHRGFKNLPPIAGASYRTPIATALCLYGAHGQNFDWPQVIGCASGKIPDFIRDWIYRGLLANRHTNSDVSSLMGTVQVPYDLESILNEISISNAINVTEPEYVVCAALKERLSYVTTQHKMFMNIVTEKGYGQHQEWNGKIPDIILGSRVMRSDIAAFSSRFLFKTSDGYVAFGALGIAMGCYVLIYDGHQHTLIFRQGVTPDPSVVANICKLDSAALVELDRSTDILINPNFPRFGDCLDRFGFVHEVLRQADAAGARPGSVRILETVKDNFIDPKSHKHDQDAPIVPIGELFRNRFIWSYINACYFRNNVDRRLSFSKGMVTSLAYGAKYDPTVILLEKLVKDGYFVVHFSIEAEKRAFSNQWEAIAKTMALLKNGGVNKIVLLNSGLTASPVGFDHNISQFEMDWIQNIIDILPKSSNISFAPIDLHLKSAAVKARAISSANFFIGGLVTPTIIPAANDVVGFILGSKVSLSDEYRWIAGSNLFFFPVHGVQEFLSEQAANVPKWLHSQYMSYKVDSDILDNRLQIAVSVALKRWMQRKANMGEA